VAVTGNSVLGVPADLLLKIVRT